MTRTRKLLWSLLLTFSTLGCLELFARIYLPTPEQHGIPMQYDRTLMWGITEDHLFGGTERVNALGLRGPEVATKKAGTVRLLTLGDSSIFGDQVRYNEIFSSVAAQMLKAEVPDIDAVVGGIPGYSSFQAVRLLDRIGEPVAPDLVIIGTLWSDAFRGQSTDADTQADMANTNQNWDTMASKLDGLARYSAMVRFFQFHLRQALRPEEVRKVGWTTNAGVPNQGTARVPLPDYRQNLQTLADNAKKLGAMPVFLLLPHPFDDKGQPLVEQQSAYRSAMRETAAATHVPLVDGEAWFKEHPGSNRFADDIHPNAAGHLEIAKALVTVMRADPEISARLQLR